MRLQRFKDLKILVCGKDSIPLPRRGQNCYKAKIKVMMGQVSNLPKGSKLINQ